MTCITSNSVNPKCMHLPGIMHFKMSDLEKKNKNKNIMVQTYQFVTEKVEN